MTKHVRHIWAKSTVIENCVFGKYGRGNWLSSNASLLETLTWRDNPWDLIANAQISGSQHSSLPTTAKSEKIYPDDVMSSKVNLTCGSSTDLVDTVNSAEFDIIITDPPFGGLLHYSELSDFFYVWLRLALKNRYHDYFGSDYTPKTLEAVSNSARHPDNPDSIYEHLLTACWSESYRILKSSGLMAFTYHHSDPRAWVPLLESLFSAGFVLVATYPMRAMEGMSRKFKHVDLDRRILHICDDGDFKLKNANSARDIPLPNEVRNIILRIKSERKGATNDDYIFVKPDGSALVKHDDHAYHVVTRTLAALNRAKRKAGVREIPYFTIRMLRHWFISWALNRPVNALSETQLIKIVGHADFAMVRDTYYHLDVEGESGRKMRETPLFSGLFASGDAVKVDEKQVDAAGSADSDGGDDIMFNFSLRGA